MRSDRCPVRLASALVLLGALVLAGCGSNGSGANVKSADFPAGQPGKGKPAVTFGTKNFTEQYILGQLYAQALRAKGYTVNLKLDIGPSEVTDSALTSGRIDLYPEYTGVIVSVVSALGTLTAPGAPAQPKTPPASAKEAYRQAADFESSRGFTMLNPTPFQDADRIATTAAFAKAHALVFMKDLKKLGSFTHGAPPENKNRYEGLRGMKQAYGLGHVVFVGLPIGSQYQALDSGEVDTIAVFTADPQLVRGKYAVLSDPKNIFGYQNVAPVVSKKVLTKEGPDFAHILNAVSAKLTADAVQRLNAAVVLDHRRAADVAGTFLTSNGLK